MTGVGFEDIVRLVAVTAVEQRAAWDALDAAVGDGDFGTTMHRGFAAVLDAWPELDRGTPADLLTGVAQVLSRVTGGSSGPLWTVGVLRAADAVRPGLSVASVGAALRAAAAGVGEYGGAKPGDKTLLDALVPAADAVLALAAAAPPEAARAAARAAALAAQRGAAQTAGYPARRGRAAYAGTRAIGQVDPGAVAVATLATAVANRLGAALDLPAFAPAAAGGPGAEPDPAATKQFINDPADAVTESLEGYALAFGDLVVWEPADRIVRRRVPSPGKVGLVSGGGSGHEPLHAGFVGAGMLDAVAPGPVFASPTVHQALAATLAADGGAGVVQLVKNYTGDLINFGIAAEFAAARGVDVRRVVISDDIGIDPVQHDVGRRGTGATVLVEKIAGAAAQAGEPIAAVAEVAAEVVRRTRSFGIALGSCSPPGRSPILSLGPDEIEIGVGIHGERGRRRARHQPSDELVRTGTDALLASLAPPPGTELLVMVSGLGATTLLEHYVVYRALVAELAAAGHQVTRRLVGPYLTALNMPGIVLTVAVLDERLRQLWDAPVLTAGLRWGR
ncbi:MAG TPA: dihydroxyacetone kinase subunit DhaK [Mycobacteriales bacterium]|nr:dihydroxyacetone kinase subunit DhaK [Mycobacteriales bacterium]